MKKIMYVVCLCCLLNGCGLFGPEHCAYKDVGISEIKYHINRTDIGKGGHGYNLEFKIRLDKKVICTGIETDIIYYYSSTMPNVIPLQLLYATEHPEKKFFIYELTLTSDGENIYTIFPIFLYENGE